MNEVLVRTIKGNITGPAGQEHPIGSDPYPLPKGDADRLAAAGWVEIVNEATAPVEVMTRDVGDDTPPAEAAEAPAAADGKVYIVVPDSKDRRGLKVVNKEHHICIATAKKAAEKIEAGKAFEPGDVGIDLNAVEIDEE